MASLEKNPSCQKTLSRSRGKILSRYLVLVVAGFFCLPRVGIAQAPSPTPMPFEITSPAPGTTIGGLVAIWGTVNLPGIQNYTIAFAPSRDAVLWIPITDSRHEPVVNGRLALWDTTRVPDGVYTLRLRGIRPGKTSGIEYVDFYVEGILISNAPRTPTPLPTAIPTATPSPTPLPTATPTPWPTPSLDEGISPYLYLTMLAQYDPLCVGWQQRFGIWVSNVGTLTVTNITLTDILPQEARPILDISTPEGVLSDDGRTVEWTIPDLAPGQGYKIELQIELPSWVKPGTWLTNRVSLASDQVPYLARSTGFIVSECPWLKATAAALPLPTIAPSPSPSPTPSPVRPTPRPTITAINVSIPDEAVNRSLDVLTTVVTVALIVLSIVLVVLLYQRLARRR